MNLNRPTHRRLALSLVALVSLAMAAEAWAFGAFSTTIQYSSGTQSTPLTTFVNIPTTPQGSTPVSVVCPPLHGASGAGSGSANIPGVLFGASISLFATTAPAQVQFQVTDLSGNPLSPTQQHVFTFNTAGVHMQFHFEDAFTNTSTRSVMVQWRSNQIAGSAKQLNIDSSDSINYTCMGE